MIHLNRLYQELAERGEQTRKENRPAIFQPRLAIHLDSELAVAGERNPIKLDFKIFYFVENL
jgi:hypothetical protein